MSVAGYMISLLSSPHSRFFLSCPCFCISFQDDGYVPVMKDSNIDVKALSSAYKEKKKMRDDSNVVKIGKRIINKLLPYALLSTGLCMPCGDSCHAILLMCAHRRVLLIDLPWGHKNLVINYDRWLS